MKKKVTISSINLFKNFDDEGYHGKVCFSDDKENNLEIKIENELGIEIVKLLAEKICNSFVVTREDFLEALVGKKESAK